MKKAVRVILSIVVIAAALACGILVGCDTAPHEEPITSPPPTEPVPDVVTVIDIVDRAEKENLPTDDALEGFWKDEEYTYYFSSIRSQYIIVYYSDETQEPVRDAMAAGRVTIADLDTYGIKYYKEPKE